MKKIVPIVLVGILVLSGLGAVAIADNSPETSTKVETIAFSELTIDDQNEYVSVSFDEQTSLQLQTGEPVLPVYTKVFTFPHNTKIHSVNVAFSEPRQIALSKMIQPAQAPIPKMQGFKAQPVKQDLKVYSSDSLYPEDQWSYSVKAGLYNGVQSVYVSVRCNPVQYLPSENIIQFSDNVKITVDYNQPKTTTFIDEVDLVVITPAEFEAACQPLVDHKNDNGVVTEMKTLEDIYDEYGGRDAQEDIKLYIYNMKEDYNITYALLVGGRQGQTFNWYLPERVTHNDDGWERGYASDLYYGDVYKIVENETVFEDWDSDGDGIFAEYSNMIGKGDQMDFIPDVYVGRLAARKVKHVEDVVQKIITYESSTSREWFANAFTIAGDTFPGGDTQYEGEIETALSGGYLEDAGFTVTNLWTSTETFTGKEDVISQFGPGAGMVHFAGHGNPSTWSNHPPDDEETWITGYSITDAGRLKNGENLPVVVVGGCHNTQFNVTFANLIKGILTEGFEFFQLEYFYKEWVPFDWTWSFVKQPNGGAIGGIGMSSLGYGYIGSHTTEGLGGWLDTRFFHSYAVQENHVLGQAQGQAVADYVTIIGNVNTDPIDRKSIEAWTLLGDPSLFIGEPDA